MNNSDSDLNTGGTSHSYEESTVAISVDPENGNKILSPDEVEKLPAPQKYTLQRLFLLTRAPP